MMYKLFTCYPWDHPENLLAKFQKMYSFQSPTEFIMAKTLTVVIYFGIWLTLYILEIFFILPSLFIGAGQKIKHSYFINILPAKITHVNFRLVGCKPSLLVNMSGRQRRGWHAKCARISPTLLNKFSSPFLTIT